MNSHTGQQSRTRQAVALIVGVLLLTACSVPPGQEGRRGPTPLGDQYYVMDATTVSVEVQSCHGDPELRVFEQTETEVRIEVVATTYTESLDCQDSVAVDLDEPIGDRAVIDLTTGVRLALGDP